MPSSLSPLVSGVLGAAAGAASGLLARRTLADRAPQVAALSLVPMAAIYPAGRRSLADRPALARELVGVAAMAGATAAALRSGPRMRTLAAVGWAGHALFDATHDLGDDSRLPDWYRPMCAGFDATYALTLATGR